MRNLDAIEVQLCDDLKLRAEALYKAGVTSSNTPWTSEFKKSFQILAGNNYTPFGCGDHRELLWDIALVSGSGETPWSLKLACEMEWNSGTAALEDFRKLTLSNAEYRVIIFDSEVNHRKFESKVSDFRASTPQGDNSKYLAIGIPGPVHGNLKVEAW